MEPDNRDEIEARKSGKAVAAAFLLAAVVLAAVVVFAVVVFSRACA